MEAGQVAKLLKSGILEFVHDRALDNKKRRHILYVNLHNGICPIGVHYIYKVQLIAVHYLRYSLNLRENAHQLVKFQKHM